MTDHAFVNSGAGTMLSGFAHSIVARLAKGDLPPAHEIRLEKCLQRLDEELRDAHIEPYRVSRVTDAATLEIGDILYGLPSVLLQSIITFGPRGGEGKLIECIDAPWRVIVELLRRDPNAAYQIPPAKWEEIIAGAYWKAGFDEVILTPRSGDRGAMSLPRNAGSGAFVWWIM